MFDQQQYFAEINSGCSFWDSLFFSKQIRWAAKLLEIQLQVPDKTSKHC